jgi:hypothetical protein
MESIGAAVGDIGTISVVTLLIIIGNLFKAIILTRMKTLFDVTLPEWPLKT